MTAADIGEAYAMEWRRKIEPEIYPGMPTKNTKPCARRSRCTTISSPSWRGSGVC
jgi:hypothetical protein